MIAFTCNEISAPGAKHDHDMRSERSPIDMMEPTTGRARSAPGGGESAW